MEWEAAARGPEPFVVDASGEIVPGGSHNRFPWGNERPRNTRELSKKSMLLKKGQAVTAPVGSFEADKSWWGLYDMAGNVREWTDSAFEQYDKPKASGSSLSHIRFGRLKKVLRGSSPDHANGRVNAARLGNRSGAEPTEILSDVGFRCAKDG